MVGLSAVLQLSASFSPASGEKLASVGSLHADKTCDDITCSRDKGLRMAAAADAMTSKTGRGLRSLLVPIEESGASLPMHWQTKAFASLLSVAGQLMQKKL